MPPERPPKVFISYSQDSPEHMARLLQLADQLRTDGVDADIDQYESSPPEGWAMWMDRQIRDADFILIICTETYQRRAEGREEFGKGRGVIWECILTFQYLHNSAANNTRFIPVLVDLSHRGFIPIPLQPASYYCIATSEGYEELYRRLTNQPRVVKPPLGKLKVFESQAGGLMKPPSLEPRERQESITKFWNLPFNRNPLFTGREDVLAALRSDLERNARQSVCGLGGMGKTEIAVEYAYRYRDQYASVLWSAADSLESLKAGFSKLARLLDLPEKDDSHQEAVIAAVKAWLESNSGWLFIFDNADAPGLLWDFIPQNNRGHILITSRAEDFREIGITKPIAIHAFNSMEAREFLLKRTMQGKKAVPEQNLEEADQVAAELGNLPLALGLAGAYIFATQSSLKDYLSKFKGLRVHF